MQKELTREQKFQKIKKYWIDIFGKGSLSKLESMSDIMLDYIYYYIFGDDKQRKQAIQIYQKETTKLIKNIKNSEKKILQLEEQQEQLIKNVL